MKKPLQIKRVRLFYLLPLSNDDRYLDCKYYDKCLYLVAKRHWASFSCKKCPLYRS